MGRVGRVALRLLYDAVLQGGGELGPSTGWAPGRRIHIMLHMARRPIKLVGGTVDDRVYSDACTAGAGVRAVALFGEDFVVELRG